MTPNPTVEWAANERKEPRAMFKICRSRGREDVLGTKEIRLLTSSATAARGLGVNAGMRSAKHAKGRERKARSRDVSVYTIATKMPSRRNFGRGTSPERGVYAASSSQSPQANRFVNEARILKRPKGGAPGAVSRCDRANRGACLLLQNPIKTA
jgi:hypothetical protein